ncbi:MAG: HlyC/CorC family transporter [Microbacteriaceae bacterium]|nr:HlyC/CorC family transporter [Microbacteriaceae bacterium]
MDSHLWLNIALVVLFVLVGGVFAGTEMAIVSLRRAEVAEFERAGAKGARIAGLVRDPNLFLSAVQVGVTLAGFLSSAYGASTIAPALEPVLVGWGLAPDVANTIALIGLTLLIAFLSLVFGELVPKRLAMLHAAAFTRVLAPPLMAIAWLLRPVIFLLSASTNLVLRLLGQDPSRTRAEVSVDDIAELVGTAPDLGTVSRAILADTLGAKQRRLEEVMRPRPDVEFLDAELTVAEALAEALELPYSRYPLLGESVDDIVGFVHLRDLAHAAARGEGARPVRELARPILALPGSNRAMPTLGQMRDSNHHLALVVDEYGGTDGIVTVEDLIEEVIGEIYDEFDTGVDPEDSVLHRDESADIDGGLIIQELEALVGVDLPDGPGYETVAGFVLDRLDRLARAGDVVEVDGVRLEVLAVQGNRITRVRVTPLTDEAERDHRPSEA